MVKKRFNKAFSLVEMLMAMLIVAITSCALVPVLTTSRPSIETVSMRGQFACFYDEQGNLRQWQFRERSPITTAPIRTENGTTCKLKFDQRPAYFYIVAMGAGSQRAQGQLVTKYTNELSSELEIQIDRYQRLGASVVKSEQGASEVIAGAAAELGENGISGPNIRTCRLISATVNNDVDCATGCEIVQNVNTAEYFVKFHGCSSTNSLGNEQAALFPLDGFRIQNQNLTLNANELSQNTTTKNAGFYQYFQNSANQARVAFEVNDSMFAPNSHLTGLLLPNGNTPNANKMVQVLETISGKRRSVLIDRLIQLRPGQNNRANNTQGNGAVLILW